MKINKNIDSELREIEILVSCRTDDEFNRIFSKLDDRLTLETVDGIRRISQAELDYIEVVGNYLELHTADKIYKLRSPLYRFISNLSDDFVRVSRSYLINFSKLNSVEADVINGMVARVGLNNVKIPISQVYLKSIKEKAGGIK